MERPLADVSRRYFSSLDFDPSTEGGRQPSKPGTTQNHLLQGIRISRPNLAETFIPVVGPAWEAAADFQDGDYTGAAFNGAMAVLDALPVGVAAKGLRAASKGVGVWKAGSLTANAARKAYRARGMAKAGEEAHHAFELNGISRSAQNWRNHYAFLKPLPQSVHRRLTGRWGDLPRYGPPARIWYGTTDWMKAVPAGVAGYGADSAQNFLFPARDEPPNPMPDRRGDRQNAYSGDGE